MLGVDRLDMIKGIPQKILAFEKFLEENPIWRDKVVLVQIAVPTRTDVPECMYLHLRLNFTDIGACYCCYLYHHFPCLYCCLVGTFRKLFHFKFSNLVVYSF